MKDGKARKGKRRIGTNMKESERGVRWVRYQNDKMVYRKRNNLQIIKKKNKKPVSFLIFRLKVLM